ncbi:MAG TPA: cell division ATP-binding protein FtsE [Chthonomonadales bacterium]|nr:cell division ATP-binding protein FtsE [Chthonomonadales bacterium]
MIELQNVSVFYAGERTALSHINLRIEKGEFVFIVGSTGAGKSTLLRLLYREEIPTSGKVIVAGQNLALLKPRDVPYLRRRMGVVFQDFGLLPNRTVFENVAFALRVIGAGRREIRRKVPAVLDLVGLTHRCDALPHEISGGEQQRVAIARALVNDPPLLLADEPTGNLDPDTSLGIAQLLAHVNLRGTTIIVATHDKQIVDQARRRVVELEWGRIVRDEKQGAYTREAVY